MPGLFPFLRLFQVVPLDIADLRDDDDFFAGQLTALDQFAQDRTNEALTVAIHIIGRRIDQIDAFSQGLPERVSMLGVSRVDPIGPEPQSRCRQRTVAEAAIAMLHPAVLA